MQVTMVTGCSSGIGQATAVYLARQGYQVYATMRNPERDGEKLVDIANTEGLQLELMPLDVTDVDACEWVVGKILKENSQLDILINNAGIADGGYLEDVSENVIRGMFDVNFFAAMRLMQLIIPSMRKRQSGTIVNISSIMGRLARAGGSAYAASKFALEAASEALAQEVRRFNIRVVLIEPGVVKTRLHEPKDPSSEPSIDSPYEEFNERGARLFGSLLQTPAYPEDVAQVIHQAIETDTPKLRYLVGEDAFKWMVGRQTLTDEAWVELGNKMDLDAYVAFYRDVFGMEI